MIFKRIIQPILLLSYTFKFINVSAYSEPRVQEALNIAQASYCVTENWDCLTCEEKNVLEQVIEKEGERILVGYNTEKDEIFVSSRGSENIMNWIDNIQFRKISPYSDSQIEVEKGFYKLYSKLMPEIFDSIQFVSEKYDAKDILITGHSLGGALSTLLAYDISQDTMYDFELITFGCPRVGNQRFVESLYTYGIKNTRVTHYRDMVPHLPQEVLGYIHAPSEIWYNEKNTDYKICDDSITMEDDTCSDSCGPTHCTSIDDHLDYLNVTLGVSGC